MDKREKTIPVRVSLEEEKVIKEKADKMGLKASTYLRVAGLEKN
jgi:predicted DNA binding CopG/RHH family protein